MDELDEDKNYKCWTSGVGSLIVGKNESCPQYSKENGTTVIGGRGSIDSRTRKVCVCANGFCSAGKSCFCDRGRYINRNNNNICTDCDDGSYTDFQNQTECVKCPNGQTNDSNDRTKCFDSCNNKICIGKCCDGICTDKKKYIDCPPLTRGITESPDNILNKSLGNKVPNSYLQNPLIDDKKLGRYYSNNGYIYLITVPGVNISNIVFEENWLGTDYGRITPNKYDLLINTNNYRNVSNLENNGFNFYIIETNGFGGTAIVFTANFDFDYLSNKKILNKKFKMKFEYYKGAYKQNSAGLYQNLIKVSSNTDDIKNINYKLYGYGGGNSDYYLPKQIFEREDLTPATVIIGKKI